MLNSHLQYWVSNTGVLYDLDTKGHLSINNIINTQWSGSEIIYKLLECSWTRMTYDQSHKRLSVNSSTHNIAKKAIKTFIQIKNLEIQELYLDINTSGTQTKLVDDAIDYYISKGKIKSLLFS